MEVLTSTNRMSTITFLSLYFLANMAPDCTSNFMGPAYNTLHRSFITNFIFIAFLLLCTIPLRVQLVTICDTLYFYKHFNIIFKKIYHVLQTVLGLYQVARQCRQLQVPEHKWKKTTQGSSQQLIQTSPPIDECIPVLQTRLILIRLTKPSPLLAPPNPQKIPALQQDRATEEFVTETFSEPFTPIRHVQPLLGTTHREIYSYRIGTHLRTSPTYWEPLHFKGM